MAFEVLFENRIVATNFSHLFDIPDVGLGHVDAAAGHQAGPGVRGARRLQDVPLRQLRSQHSLLLPGKRDILRKFKYF